MKRVEPEWALVTVLFVDIRAFTAFADRSSARAGRLRAVPDRRGDQLGAGAGGEDRRRVERGARRDRRPVNVAARVQDATREPGEPLLLTEATHALLEQAPVLEPRGALTLRGKARLTTVYAPVTVPGRRTRRKEPEWQL